MPRGLLGKPAPEFELPSATGQIYRNIDFSGGWLLLVFHRHLM
jgi:peroxiredoxin